MKSRTKFLLTFTVSLIATSAGIEKIDWAGMRPAINENSSLMSNLLASDQEDLNYLRGCYALGEAEKVESCFEFLTPSGIRSFSSSLTAGHALLHRFEAEGDEEYRLAAKMVLSASLRNYSELYDRCHVFSGSQEGNCPGDIAMLLKEKEDDFRSVRDLLLKL